MRTQTQFKPGSALNDDQVQGIIGILEREFMYFEDFKDTASAQIKGLWEDFCKFARHYDGLEAAVRPKLAGHLEWIDEPADAA